MTVKSKVFFFPIVLFPDIGFVLFLVMSTPAQVYSWKSVCSNFQRADVAWRGAVNFHGALLTEARNSPLKPANVEINTAHNPGYLPLAI